MSNNINDAEVIQITPEVREMLKKNYFYVNKAKFPSFFAGSVLMAYLFMGLAIFVIFYFEPVFLTYLFAAILVSMSFFYTFKWFKPYYAQKQQYALRPSTDQIENWLVKDIKEKVKPAAIDMLSLNPATITPDNFIIIPHPVWWHIDGIEDKHIVRYNAGEYFVYATHNISIFALTDNYISFYNCTFDWLENQIVNPFTLEFFFDDISSIRVENKHLDYPPIDYEEPEPEIDEETGKEIPPPEKPSVGTAQTVIVKNKSGESMDAITNIPELEASPRMTLKTEKVMQTLRIMLRNRRYGEEFEIIRPKNEEQIDSENPEDKQ
jgi:hypothetical protein